MSKKPNIFTKKLLEDEQKNLDELKDHGFGETLKLSTEEFSRFDAYSDKVIVEFKRRDRDYAEQMIEGTKLFDNFHYAQTVGKTFFYVVFSPKYILIWNINEHFAEHDVTFMRRSLPTNQHRGGKDYIFKMITYVPIETVFKKIIRTQNMPPSF